jgi:hypothetical protein
MYSRDPKDTVFGFDFEFSFTGATSGSSSCSGGDAGADSGLAGFICFSMKATMSQTRKR